MALLKIPARTVGTTVTPLADTEIRAHTGFTVRAATTNTGVVWLGGSDVATDGSNGFPLAAGDTVDLVGIVDLSKAWAKATLAGQKLYFLGGDGA